MRILVHSHSGNLQGILIDPSPAEFNMPELKVPDNMSVCFDASILQKLGINQPGQYNFPKYLFALAGNSEWEILENVQIKLQVNGETRGYQGNHLVSGRAFPDGKGNLICTL